MHGERFFASFHEPYAWRKSARSNFCLRRAAVCALARLHAAGAKAPASRRAFVHGGGLEAALVLGYEFTRARARLFFGDES